MIKSIIICLLNKLKLFKLCFCFQSPSDKKTGEVKTLFLHEDLLFAGDDKGIVSSKALLVSKPWLRSSVVRASLKVSRGSLQGVQFPDAAKDGRKIM